MFFEAFYVTTTPDCSTFWNRMIWNRTVLHYHVNGALEAGLIHFKDIVLSPFQS